MSILHNNESTFRQPRLDTEFMLNRSNTDHGQYTRANVCVYQKSRAFEIVKEIEPRKLQRQVNSK